MASHGDFSNLVVIGASAGGVEALSEVVAGLPEDFPAPVVIAQHLDPERASRLRQILSRRSALPVHTVTDHAPLEAGVIFVVPSNRHVNITDSELNLTQDSHGRPMPSVELLFSSAAKSFGERLIAVILSGTGSDGTEGARIVRGAGGMVIIQNPSTARFGSMPGSLAPNTVEIVSELDEIGPVLTRVLRDGEVSEEESQPEDEKHALDRFLEVLRERHGIDFRSSYKSPTIMRRLKRRMVATGAENIEAYARYLDENPEEYKSLINAFLIKVTEFFRDPALFEYLRDKILPRLIEEARARNRQRRIWSAGCATGEEAYSLAILLSEILGGEAGLFNVRIFATDIDEEAVNFARQGIYPASALSGLSEGQIERYFVEEDGQYQVKKPVRSMIVFGEHDLTRRSPFPRIDLVVSRNVLIYFAAELQRRALHLFAYSLRDGGCLVLGKAETISPLSEFFVSEHRQHKVFRRQGERFLMPPTIPVSLAPRAKIKHGTGAAAPDARTTSGLTARRRRAAEEGLLNRLPVGVVVVDQSYDIQAINSAARRLLSIRGAAIGQDLLHALREMPYAEVRRAIDSAFRDGASVTGEFSVEEASTEELRYIRLIFHPQRREGEKASAEAVTIVVDDVTEIGRERRRTQETKTTFERLRSETEAERSRWKTQNERLVEANRGLEEANRELTELNEELQGSYEEVLLGAEESQAATEEVETLNEEHQATNEELETLNEELQATIEELNTTNDDLQARTSELQELARTSEEERERLRAIRESIPEAVLVVDAAGRNVLTNAAYGRLFGESDLVALDNIGETPQSRVASGKPYGAEFQVLTREGERRRIRAEGQPIGQDGGRGGVIVIQPIKDG